MTTPFVSNTALEAAASKAVDGPLAQTSHPNTIYSVSHDYLRQIVLTSLPLVLADVVAIAISIACGALVVELLVVSPVNHYLEVFGLLLGSIFIVNVCFGLYPAAGLHPIRELQRLSISTTLVNGILFVGAFWPMQPTSPYLPLLAIMWLVLTTVQMPLRCFVRHFCRNWNWWGFNAVLIGCGVKPAELTNTLSRERRRGVKLVGFFSSNVEYWSKDFHGPDGCHYLGPLDEIRHYVATNRISWAFVPQSTLSGRPLQTMFRKFGVSFPNLVVVNDQHVMPGLWNDTIEFENGVSGLRLREQLLLRYPRFIKRSFDTSMSLFGMLLLSPFFLMIAIAVRLTSRGPVFFGHKRIGIGGKHFKACKFRTMVLDADKILESYLDQHPELRQEWQTTQKLKNDPRITRVGNFLRASSLDELPQLWNVLKGEMSLVGPRPIVDNEVEKYADVFSSYLRVRPGITGLWQISGRNDTTYEQRVSFDQYYVSNWSLWMDLYILGRTLKTVLLREGAY